VNRVIHLRKEKGIVSEVAQKPLRACSDVRMVLETIGRLADLCLDLVEVGAFSPDWLLAGF
jgi:hypothetical protein